jgi:hypothetical protein
LLTLLVTAVLAVLASPGVAHAGAGTTPMTVYYCQTASLYAEYSPSTGPAQFITTLYGPPAGTYGTGERVGWRADAANGWVIVLYYRTSTWGYMRGSCLRPE